MAQAEQQQELLDSLVEEFTSRIRSGERPAVVEFADRHPALRTEIEELLTSVAMIEELKVQSSTSANSLKLEMKEILKLDRIGDYRILRELGRGGMGIVFEAVHESLGRRVAIKVMPNRTFDDEKYLERFKREAQTAAKLHHTNIVSVFGLGRVGEHHYYVMEFVDGECLSDILSEISGRSDANTEKFNGVETLPQHRPQAEQPATNGEAKRVALSSNTGTIKHEYSRARAQRLQSPRERYSWAARIGMQIADGLAYAHAMETLHRDIKPANLLVDRHETVWLTDFGLVKNLGKESITKTGDIIGTPQYMAPESFEGQYDERSETFCLGLTLYEMVTLQPAYENASTPELIRRITTASPIPPRKINRSIPRDLNRIIEKSISREPSWRYRTAAEMRDDLLAFLDDRPIKARRISMTENIWRWSRRNPLSASLALATGVMICAIAVLATVFLTKAKNDLYKQREQTTSLQVEKRVASLARNRAEDNINFTVDLFDEMFRKLVWRGENPDEDSTLEGFNQLTGLATAISESDAEYLEQMLQFYMEFAEKNRENVTLKTLAAKSYRRVANIHQLTGEFVKADSAYGKSVDIYRSLQLESPTNIPLVLSLARTLREKGQAIEATGDQDSWREAIDEYSRAEKRLREHPSEDHPDLRFELAQTLIHQASPRIWLLPEIPQRFAEVIGTDRRSRFAVGNGKRNRQPFRVARPAKARKSMAEAIAIADELIARSPKDPRYHKLKATALTQMARLELAAGNVREGRKLLRQAVTLADGLIQNSDNPDFNYVLAQIRATPVRSQPEQQVKSLEQAKELLTVLVARHENNIAYQQLLASVNFRLGDAWREQDNSEAAINNLKSANALYQQLLAKIPGNRQIQMAGFATMLQLVDLQLQSDQFDGAVRVLESSIRNCDEILEKRDRDLVVFRMKAGSQAALAVVHRDAGNSRKATAYRMQARTTMRRARSEIVDTESREAAELTAAPD